MCFSSGVYLYFRILVKCHEQYEIGCGAILNIKYILLLTDVFGYIVVTMLRSAKVSLN